MQIKPNHLLQQIKKKSFPLYWLAGQDTYLIENSLKIIKNYLKNQYEYDENIISIETPNDWQNAFETANNYSLFSDTSLLNIVYDKKSLDNTGKKIITDYLKNFNTRCFLIVRTPHIPAKQLQWLASLTEALFIMHYPLTTEAMKQWIIEELKAKELRYDINVPILIQQYTQGNMLACAQLIEKISLNFSASEYISNQDILEQVSNQCEYSLYELVDACLLGKKDQSIQILRNAANNKSECTLVLWILTQEIRLLLQLHYLTNKTTDFKSACSQLKIWPQRVGMYQNALKRIPYNVLKELIHGSFYIDEQIKSNLNSQSWNSLELIIHSLCTGKNSLCIL